MIQQLFEKTVNTPINEPPLLQLTNIQGGKLTSDRLTVAHHRVRNLGELLSYRKFRDNGTPVSVHFERRNQECRVQQQQQQQVHLQPQQRQISHNLHSHDSWIQESASLLNSIPDRD